MLRVLVPVLLAPILAWAEPDPLLGLPELPIPENNPQSGEKVALGERLFHDTRFSTTGTVSCASCHDADKGFTDSPLVTSEGINKLRGTRNAPTVLNAAFNETQFWDGRSPTLEDQALHPFVNPVEMGLKNHDPLLETIRQDAEYQEAFKTVFGVSGEQITMDHVTQAIAAFERTQIAGNSPFDRWYFGGEENAVDEQVKRGFEVFLNQGRCVSCHMIEQDHALFTDHRFHNIGVGINDIQHKLDRLTSAFLQAKAQGADVDKTVLSDPDSSHLGRFAVDEQITSLGAFKTPTLRNLTLTAPYMHDGSLETLKDVVVHYDNGGVSDKEQTPNPFLSGAIRPLDLSEQQIDDLVAFMEALTSSQLEPEQGKDEMAAQRPAR